MAGWFDPLRRLWGWLQSAPPGEFEPGGIRIYFAEPIHSIRFGEPVRRFRFPENGFMRLITVEKTDDEVLPYEFDLTDWTTFDSSAITSAPVTAEPSGLTIASPVISGKIVQAKISGGVEGAVYKVTCKPQTAEGYVGEVAFNLVIVNN
jgi:hypothetical protein